MKPIKQFERSHYIVPGGEIMYIPDDVVSEGEESILKYLIYMGATNTFKEFNKVDIRTILIICEFYDLHIYEDMDEAKHPDAHIRYVGYEKVLSKISEEKYFDVIEMAANDFHAKRAYQGAMDKVIEDFIALFTSNDLEADCSHYAFNHFDTEQVSFKYRHERFNKADGFEACTQIIFDVVRHARQFDYRTCKARFLGHQTRPHGVCYSDPDTGEEKYALGFAGQEENQKALFVTIKGTYDELILFDLGDDNKINQITIIRGRMLNLYNFVSDDPDDDFS